MEPSEMLLKRAEGGSGSFALCSRPRDPGGLAEGVAGRRKLPRLGRGRTGCAGKAGFVDQKLSL